MGFVGFVTSLKRHISRVLQAQKTQDHNGHVQQSTEMVDLRSIMRCWRLRYDVSRVLLDTTTRHVPKSSQQNTQRVVPKEIVYKVRVA